MVGGGDRALQEALVLTRFAREVVVVHRSEKFRASGTLLGWAQEEPKISFLADTVVEEVLGDHSVEGVRVRYAKTGQGRILDIDGLFVAVGYEPHLGPFAGLLETDGGGYVVLKKHTMTSVPGVFAAGEAADGRYRQTATAVGDGSRAAIEPRGGSRSRAGFEVRRKGARCLKLGKTLTSFYPRYPRWSGPLPGAPRVERGLVGCSTLNRVLVLSSPAVFSIGAADASIPTTASLPARLLLLVVGKGG